MNILGYCPTRVLVIEDEVFIRLDVSDELRRAGFEVIEMNTADDALVFLDGGEHVDVVFTDVKLPGRLDGIALAEKTREGRPLMRFVITSGDLDKRGAAILLGEFVPKPYAPKDIVTLIAALVSRSSRSQTANNESHP